MDETTFRILNTLSRELGRPLSINELTRQIKELHGRAYYANIHKTLHILRKGGIITLAKAGRLSLVSLNLSGYATIDFLAEMELKRTRDLLVQRAESMLLLGDIHRHLGEYHLVESMSLINPERNIRLNRAELLVLLREKPSEPLDSIRGTIQDLHRRHNIRIDYLATGRDELLAILGSGERNPLKEMVADKIAFFNPQAFWMTIGGAVEKGIQVRFEREETNLPKISEQDLVSNLARFGYREFGPRINQGQSICIEYIVTSILIKDDARRIEAIPVLLAKNSVNYNLLVFLSQKYGISGRLLGLLKALGKIVDMEEVREVIRSLEAMDVREVKANQASIRERMRLYNATR